MREIAAFLGQASQETNGAAMDKFNGGLCFVEEGGTVPTSLVLCSDPNPNIEFPCTPGKSYRGRGPLQVSYNYNYGEACGATVACGISEREREGFARARAQAAAAVDLLSAPSFCSQAPQGATSARRCCPTRACWPRTRCCPSRPPCTSG
jgi:hypothetical protein